MSSGQLPKLHFLSSEFQILGTAYIFLGSLNLLSKVINAFEVLIYCLIFETLQELVLSFFKLAHYYNKFLSQAFVIQMICWKKSALPHNCINGHVTNFEVEVLVRNRFVTFGWRNLKSAGD